ncbi:MAG: Hypoxanthine-guanine phosphoribosyltransferase [Chlamydiae bacterium]|nr:Hypoxanthine-guanine phosphoribosyltransferase [Chlamydiota bacterium]
MKTIPLITEEAIAKKVEEMARILNENYAGKELIIVAILKGSVCLLADLIRFLTIPFSIEFLRASSYGEKGTERGELSIESVERLEIEGKDVLILDDIYDSGETLSAITKALEELRPKSLDSLVLLKKSVPHSGEILPTHVCFDIEDHFVVGYGLDYKEHYRGMRGIFRIEL